MSILSLGAFLLLVLAAAATGALFRPGEWYARLSKPDWTPPNWLFAPAWTFLYILIAIAGWLVWRIDPQHPALLAWAIQLLANAAWSWLFFGRHRIDLAFADIVVMWLAIAAFMFLSWPVSQAATLLFAPYLLWVAYAGALNWSILRRARTLQPSTHETR